MKTRLEKQIQYLEGYFTAKHMSESLKAMHLALKYHTGKRKNQEPEVSHQFEIVSIVLPIFENFDDLDIIIASIFLHDLVEDYYDQYDEKQLKKDFKLKTAFTVMCVTKPIDFQKTTEHYEAYFGGMQQDIRAIIVKCADRLHNFESIIDTFKQSKQEKYVLEVETYFFPMIDYGRKEYPIYYQQLTLMKRMLKTYIKFIKNSWDI